MPKATKALLEGQLKKGAPPPEGRESASHLDDSPREERKRDRRGPRSCPFSYGFLTRRIDIDAAGGLLARP